MQKEAVSLFCGTEKIAAGRLFTIWRDAVKELVVVLEKPTPAELLRKVDFVVGQLQNYIVGFDHCAPPTFACYDVLAVDPLLEPS